MPQIDAQSSTLLDKIVDQDAALTDLTKTVARGVPAMRDASENVLELNPAANFPLLTSNVNDVGQSYVGGLLQVVDKTGQDWRDLSAGVVTAGGGAVELNYGGLAATAVTAQDYVAATNGLYGAFTSSTESYAQRFWAGNTLHSTTGFSVGNSGMDGGLVTSPQVYGGTRVSSPDVYGDRVHAGNSIMDNAGFGGFHFVAGGAVHDTGGFGIGDSWLNSFEVASNGRGFFGGINLDGNGIVTGWRMVDAGFGPMYAGAYYTNVSEAGVKRDVTPVEDAHLQAVVDAPLYHYRYRPDASVVADDQTQADTWRRGPMVDDLPEHVVGQTPHGKAPDMAAMLNTAWGAIRELSAKVDALSARLEAVEP